MKKRLLSALLACLMLLGGVAFADGTEEIILGPGQLYAFSDCVVTVNEVAWYGDVQTNVLTAVGNGAPTVLAVRVQVMNRGMASRDFALDSSLRIRYGTAYTQTGAVAEEAFTGIDGLHFVLSSSILAQPLQPVSIVAYARLSSLMYYSSSLLEVELTIGGHTMIISLDGSTPATPTSSPSPTALPSGSSYVVNPSSSNTVTHQQTAVSVPVIYMDVNQRLLQNPSVVEVPVGGSVIFNVPALPNSVFDHYSFLKDGQWYTGYGSSVIIYTDQYGNVDKQEIDLYYRTAVVTQPPTSVPTSAPSRYIGQILEPYYWDTQFRPGVSTAPNGLGYNANVYQQLNYLHDDNPNTSISWLLYVSERTDGRPEFTVTFNGGADISAIGVRNGKVTSEQDYYANARLASIHVRLRNTSGEVFNTWVYLPDKYDPDYQILTLEKTYKNIFSVELWIEGDANQGFYMGTGDTAYTMHITDILFFSSVAAPSQNTNYGSGYSY